MGDYSQQQSESSVDQPLVDPEARSVAPSLWAGLPFSPLSAWGQQGLGGNSWVNEQINANKPPVANGPPTPAPTTGSAPPPPAPPSTSTPTATPSAGTTPAATPAKDTRTDDQKVDEAVAAANGRLSYGLFDWAITDKDARDATGSLTSLPPELQGKAVAKMDKTSFDRLLENTTNLDKESFKSLMENTTDPERKLRLWAEYEKGKASNEAEASKKDEGHWYWQTDEQKKNAESNKEIQKNLDAKKAALDGDVKAGMEKLAKGELTEQGVKGIMANRKVADLNALPPDKQSEAIGKMDKAEFDKLLTDTPVNDREKFKSLVDNTKDPERKLKLWAEYHKSKVQNEATADKKDEGTGATKTAEQLKNKDFNDQRKKIVESNNKEVDDEVKVAMEQLAKGKLSEQDVKDLMARKSKESEIERKYNVNMTNDFGKTANGTTNPATDRRTWTMKELDQISSAFDRMPPDQVTNNSALREIRREKIRKDLDGGTWKDDASVGADAGGGRIRVFDTGTGYDETTKTNKAVDPWRTKKTSELAGHKAGGTGQNAELSLVEEVITHEAGHTVHQGDNKLWDDWKKVSGWENMDQAALKKRLTDSGMSARKADLEIAAMEAKRNDAYFDRKTTDAGGRTYQVDPYSGNFLGVKKGAIPGNDEWGYAASNPEDHFAEFYAKAVHQPEALYEDMVHGPAEQQKKDEKMLKDQNDKITAMKSGGASAAQIKKEEDKLKALQKAADDSRSTAEMRKGQWDFFRNRVFKTDDKDIQGLKAPAGKEAVYDEYKKKATMCQTKQQLDALRAAYKDKL